MDLLEAVKATYLTIGQDVTDTQLAMVTSDLEEYPILDVMRALSRCRKELRKLSLVDILDRLPNSYPGVEEAWATISSSMRDESITIVWTDEMRQAFGIANAIADDPVAARMAFKEHYTMLVNEARAIGEKPNWSVSLGTNQAGRELAISEGVKQGRLQVAYAQKLLPHPEDPQTIQLLEQLCPRLLA